jgi:hypothetical protein
LDPKIYGKPTYEQGCQLGEEGDKQGIYPHPGFVINKSELKKTREIYKILIIKL